MNGKNGKESKETLFKVEDETRHIPNKKWTYETVELLMTLRMNESNKMAFERSSKFPKKIKALWEEIASEIGDGYDGNMVKDKYNNLIQIYRINIAESKKSGAGAIKWKYWKMFQKLIGNKIITEPDYKVSVGHPDDEDIILYNPLKTLSDEPNNRENKKRKSLKELKYQVFKKTLEEKKDSPSTSKHFEVEISLIKNQLKEDKMSSNKKFEELEDKLITILDILNKKLH
ncbi:hypothetical protein DMUE_3430 [Dictyocoela muelleri]|nr:hypothetical protein DMUE_3430 [Dictyocoela muelleri]